MSDPVNRDLVNVLVEDWNEGGDEWMPMERKSEAVYINLQKNPESYTGFMGGRIWDAIYSENCFYKGKKLGMDGMCYEERVFYRLISGLHAEIACHVAEYYSNEKNEIAPSTSVFMERVGNYPERIENIFFVFVFLSRAVNKAAPLLLSHNYHTGNTTDLELVQKLMRDLIKSPTISQCSAEQSFDESVMFKEGKATLKAEFKKNFQNITRIIDCIGCEKCKLHGKLHILGLGTALKILFAPDVEQLNLKRNEIIALINTLGKFSHAIHIIEAMKHRLFLREMVLYAMSTIAALFLLFIFYVAYRLCCRTAKVKLS